MTGASDRDEAVQAFLEQWRQDEAAGLDRGLGDYLQQTPGHDESIARAYLRQRHPGTSRAQEETSIGPYVLSTELGRGGQGVVFRARHSELGHDVALKLLKGLGPDSDEMLQRFYREARVAARLNHPGICQVMDAGLEDGVPFMAMQFIEGETLDKRIRVAQKQSAAGDATAVFFLDMEEPEDEAPSKTSSSSVSRKQIDQLLLLFERIARALHAAHEAGVIHRDIKPANVMVRPDGHPVLLDFGLARSADDDLETLTATGDLFGTPAYMSPEQLSRGALRIDRRTDVYSLGAALFEALTLRRPFDAPSREALYHAILTLDAPSARSINSSVPRDLSIVVAKALEKDREVRYATAEDLANELARVRELQPIIARPVGRLTRVSRWAQRNPVVAGLLTMVILVLATATVLTGREARRAERALADRTVAHQEKSAALLEYQRLADTRHLADARNRVESMWPVSPNLTSDLRAWKQEFADIIDPVTLDGHEKALRSLRERAVPYTAEDRRTDFARQLAEIDRLEVLLASDPEPSTQQAGVVRRAKISKRLGELREEIAGRGSWRFRSTDEAFRHDVLSKLVTELRAFQGSGHEGARMKIDDRLDRALRIEELTVKGPQATNRWRAVQERIRSSDTYRLRPEERENLGPQGAPDSLFDADGRMTLAPQIGLTPLGPDPRSGLEEFLHLESHAHDWSQDEVVLPERHPISADDPRGGFQMTTDTGVILVLIPAGVFHMGSQKTNEAAPNHDQGHVDREGPVHAVALGAYFLPKYEFTQGQWARGAERMMTARVHPATYGLGSFAGQPAALPAAVDGSHPVESINWPQAREFTRRLGLLLPTEAQWERAARADHPTSPWSGADTIHELSRIANISGQETAGPAASWHRSPEHRDPYTPHAPVGSFAANGFGIHDMTGNVWEWCRDAHLDYAAPTAPGDGLRSGSSRTMVCRGGGFIDSASLARVAFRYNYQPNARPDYLGLRPSRAVTMP